MEPDKLVEISPSEWIELRDLYRLNWPDNHVAWHTINNYLNWFRMEPNIKHLKIFSLNGTWRSDGTYVIVVSRLVDGNVYPETLTAIRDCRTVISCSFTRWSCRMRSSRGRCVSSTGVEGRKSALSSSVTAQLFSMWCRKRS